MAIRTDARTARSAAWARMESLAVIPASTRCTQVQAVDSSTPAPDARLHGDAPIAPERTAWTAGGLRPVELPTLPSLTADIFIQAGAIAAARAARGPDSATRGEVETILRRAAEQAGRLLTPNTVR